MDDKIAQFKQIALEQGFSDQEINDFLAQTQVFRNRAGMGNAGMQAGFNPRVNTQVPVQTGGSLSSRNFLTPQENEIYFQNLRELEAQGPEALKQYMQSKSGNPNLMREITR